jgi:hypothetical protein
MNNVGPKSAQDHVAAASQPMMAASQTGRAVQALGPAPAKLAWPAHASRCIGARPRHDHGAPGAHGGMATGSGSSIRSSPIALGLCREPTEEGEKGGGTPD